MSKALSTFIPVVEQSNLWSAQKGNLRCTALRLRDGTLCLYSPVLGLDDAARTSLAGLGEVSVLLAPNHYHHKGLKEYATAFPDATLMCSERARPRLEKQTGLTFETLGALAPVLPDDCELFEADGLKTGEVWLSLSGSDPRVWVVCDAFKGPAGKPGLVHAQIELLGTFPSFGIADKTRYGAWLDQTLKQAPPKLVVPCHGSIVQSDDLAADIKGLMG